MSSSQLMYQKSLYVTLKGNVEELLPKIEESIDFLNSGVSTLSNYFQIDDEVADIKFLEGNRDKTILIKDYLNQKIIPAIEAKIQSLDHAIQVALAREEAERRAAEEATKKAEANAATTK